MEEIEFLLDFSNIVHENQSFKKAKLKNYERIKSELVNIRPKAKILSIADARTRHIIDDKHKLESLFVKDNIIQAPLGEKADYYILNYAKRHSTVLIISNDHFREYSFRNTLVNRIIPYKIINNDVIFSEKLENYLKK